MPERAVVAGINVSIGPLDRIALLGPNGAGKSTLTKLLAGENRPACGTAHRRPRIFPSDTSRSSSWNSSSRTAMHSGICAICGGSEFAGGEEQKVRDHLGRFGFQGDRAFEPVGRFSGGEKARLTLAIAGGAAAQPTAAR